MLPILNAIILYSLIAFSVRLICLMGVLWLSAISTFSSHLYLLHLTGILLAYKSSGATFAFPFTPGLIWSVKALLLNLRKFLLVSSNYSNNSYSAALCYLSHLPRFVRFLIAEWH